MANQNNLRWLPGQETGRVPSPQRMVQPTGMEPLVALAQSWLGKKQAEERGLQGAFPALIAAGIIRPPQTGETPTFSLGGMPWVTQTPTREWKPRTEAQALRLKQAGKGITPWDIQKEARITVNDMLKGNPMLQTQVFRNPTLITDLIDEEVTRLSEQYKVTMPTKPARPTPRGKRVRMTAPDGKTYTIDQSEVKDAIANGWERG